MEPIRLQDLRVFMARLLRLFPPLPQLTCRSPFPGYPRLRTLSLVLPNAHHSPMVPYLLLQARSGIMLVGQIHALSVDDPITWLRTAPWWPRGRQGETVGGVVTCPWACADFMIARQHYRSNRAALEKSCPCRRGQHLEEHLEETRAGCLLREGCLRFCHRPDRLARLEACLCVPSMSDDM